MWNTTRVRLQQYLGKLDQRGVWGQGTRRGGCYRVVSRLGPRSRRAGIALMPVDSSPNLTAPYSPECGAVSFLTRLIFQQQRSAILQLFGTS